MRQLILALSAVLVVSGCNEPGGQAMANNTMAKPAEPAKKHPTYCFFKNADTKGWAASRDSAGNVVVNGQARVADRRYSAVLGEAEADGDQARLWLTMAPNTAAFGAPEDWWDVSAPVPASATVTSVTVMCGKKTVAELKAKKA